MGSPLYDLLSDSLLFNDHEIETGFSQVSESNLAEELSRYIEGAAKATPEIQALMPPTPGPVLSTGARLKPRQMLTQAAFYIERVVMEDPLFEAAAAWQNDQLVASELTKVEPPPIYRPGLAWIARYMKELTPMVAANYVGFLPVNRGSAFAAEALPLAPVSSVLAQAPPHVQTLLISKVRISVGNVDVPSSHGGGLEDKSAVWVEFEGLHNRWYRTLSDSERIEVVPSSAEVQRILRSTEGLTKAEWNIAQAVRYAMNQAYRNIVGEMAVAKSLNASYATESPVAFEILNAANVPSNPSKQRETGRALLNLQMPFLSDVDATTLMDIRGRYREEFRSFQRRLELGLREVRESSDQLLRERLIRDLGEDAAAEMERVGRNVKRGHKELALTTTVATVTAALASSGATGLESAVNAILPLLTILPSAMGASSRSRDSDWFFLWKVRKRATSKS